MHVRVPDIRASHARSMKRGPRLQTLYLKSCSEIELLTRTTFQRAYKGIVELLVVLKSYRHQRRHGSHIAQTAEAPRLSHEHRLSPDVGDEMRALAGHSRRGP